MSQRYRVAACLWLLGSVSAALAQSPTAAERIGLKLGPDTTVYTEPLNSLGYPDYVRILDERNSSGVSRDENFWVLMWQALGNAEMSDRKFLEPVERRLGITIANERKLTDPVSLAGAKYDSDEGKRLSDQWSEAMSRPWTRDEFPWLANWVDHHAAELELIHQAALRPKAYSPLMGGSSDDEKGAVTLLVSVLLPHVQATRHAVRLLVTRAMLRLGEGDVEGSWTDMLDCYRIARHSERGLTLIETLVGYAIRAIAHQPMAHWITTSGVSAEELRARRAELEPLLVPTGLEDAMQTERLMYCDTVLWMATAERGRSTLFSGLSNSDPDEDDPLMAVRNSREMLFSLLMIGSDINVTLQYGNRTYDRLTAALKKETHLERWAAMQEFEKDLSRETAALREPAGIAREYLFSSREKFQTITGRMLTGMLLPAVTATERAHARTIAYARSLGMAFEVQIQYLESGNLPLSEDELNADPVTFLDPFSDKPLRLTMNEKGLTIYSVGFNHVDDGGLTHNEGKDTDDVITRLPLSP